MPRHYKRTTDIKYTKEDLEKAIEDVRNKTLSLGKAAAVYSVPKSTIHDYLKDKIIQLPQSGRKAIFSEEQEKELEQHIIQFSKLFYGVTIAMVRKIAFKFAEVNNLKHNFDKTSQMAGKDWFYGFKKRHPTISLRKPEVSSINRITAYDKTEVKIFFDNLEALQNKHQFDAIRIYNVDETGISKVQKNAKILAPKSLATSGERGTTTTVVCAISASGKTASNHPRIDLSTENSSNCFALNSPDYGDPLEARSIVQYLEADVKIEVEDTQELLPPTEEPTPNKKQRLNSENIENTLELLGNYVKDKTPPTSDVVFGNYVGQYLSEMRDLSRKNALKIKIMEVLHNDEL